MTSQEIRWYKGKYKVRIIKKSNVGVKGKHLIRNMLVELLEPIEVKCDYLQFLTDGELDATLSNRIWTFPEGSELTTVPRLLWRHPRK